MTLDARTLVIILALFIDDVLTECSTGCTSCSGSTCSECESPYYLNSVICSRCPEYCKSCNGLGECTSCIANKWNLYLSCTLDCDNRCSNDTCRDDNGYCVQCKPGLYGLRCQHNCSYCTGGLCDLHRCTKGCKPGYFENKIESDSFCQVCPQDCKYCKNGVTCYVCDEGFYLNQIYLSGRTTVRCSQCSEESSCSNYCYIQNCNECLINGDSLICKDCSEGQVFNGISCILNTSNCSPECSTDCDNDGICLGKCKDGWTGKGCTNKCANKCLSCEKSNGNICQQCKGDYYTSNCTVACNPTCSIKQGKQTCRLNDGYCLNGCVDSFWGPICNQHCSEGCADIGLFLSCEISNGTCTNGCKEGYTGDKCDETSTSKTTKKPKESLTSAKSTTTQTQISAQCKGEENDDNKINFVVGFFSGLGTSIIVAAITVTLYQLRRRYVSKKLKSHHESHRTIEMPTYYNENTDDTNDSQGAVGSNYVSLGNNRNTDKLYTDLETANAQQNASYYNIGVTN